LYSIDRVGPGVLIWEPSKGELAPHWPFKTPAIAGRSELAIIKMFKADLDKDEFVGADPARKFPYMGHTYARGFPHYKAGRKHDKGAGSRKERGTGDPSRPENAAIFYRAGKRTGAEPRYAARSKAWRGRHG
jgi:hypothetical protein